MLLTHFLFKSIKSLYQGITRQDYGKTDQTELVKCREFSVWLFLLKFKNKEFSLFNPKSLNLGTIPKNLNKAMWVLLKSSILMKIRVLFN